MARKIRFALKLKNDYEARKNIQEIRDHFDLKKVLEYLQDGRLVQWLRAHQAEKEAKDIEAIDLKSQNLAEQICQILKITDNSQIETIDSQKLFQHNNKLRKLKQYTVDEEILRRVDCVAFDDKDLTELINQGKHQIILCHNTFTIPLDALNTEYIGIDKAKVIISSNNPLDFDEKKIAFNNLEFNDQYSKVCEAWNKALEAESQNERIKYFEEAAEQGSDEAMFKLGVGYEFDFGEQCDISKAVKWYKRASEVGNVNAMNNLAGHYYSGEGVEESIDRAAILYQKAAIGGNVIAQVNLGWLYINGDGVPKNENTAFKLFQMAAKAGYSKGMYGLGYSYEHGISDVIRTSDNKIFLDKANAIYWYKKAANLGDLAAKFAHNRLWYNKWVASELLGVLVHGKLRDGTKLWDEPKLGWDVKLTYYPLNEEDYEYLWKYGNNIPKWIEEGNETIIGYVDAIHVFSKNEYFVFTDKALYIQNEKGKEYKIEYSLIRNIDFQGNPSGKSSDLKMYLTLDDDEKFIMPEITLWVNKFKQFGLQQIRLFLLTVSCILGNDSYQFTEEEHKKLEQVCLKSLLGKNIFEVFLL